MLHLIPAPLHRQLYRIADNLRRRWWRVRKPRRSSVVMLAVDDADRVLLVRHSYGRPLWVLPAGGVGRREEPRVAAVREFQEELGCAITDLRELETEDVREAGAIDRQYVFVARLAGTPQPDMREVIAVQLCDPASLPVDTSRLSSRRIAQWRALQ